MIEKIGIDIGGVIIGRHDDSDDTSFFGDNYLRTPAVTGALDALTTINKAGTFAGNCHLISKCGKKTENRTREWLSHNHFHDATGIDEAHLHFCRERKQKAELCDELGITRFVDDRLEVLTYLAHLRWRYLFDPTEDEMRRFEYFLPEVIIVKDWIQLINRLRQ